jgi:hypothetical protein
MLNGAPSESCPLDTHRDCGRPLAARLLALQPTLLFAHLEALGSHLDAGVSGEVYHQGLLAGDGPEVKEHSAALKGQNARFGLLCLIRLKSIVPPDVQRYAALVMADWDARLLQVEQEAIIPACGMQATSSSCSVLERFPGQAACYCLKLKSKLS